MVGGISKQPPALRFPTQAEWQINCISSAQQGLGRRQGTEYITTLMPGQNPGVSDDLWHWIDRDQDEQYLLHWTSNNGRVWDINGGASIPFSVTSTANNYLNNGGLRAMTVADYTFVCSQNAEAEMRPGSVTPTPPSGSMVVVKSGDYGQKYTVNIRRTNDATLLARAEYVTQLGTDPSHVLDLDVQNIAQSLVVQVNSLGGAWTSYRTGATVIIQHATLDFYVEAIGPTPAAMKAINGNVALFSDLPPVAANNYLCSVGDPAVPESLYWVKYTTARGQWEEATAAGILSRLNEGTLPIQIVRNANGTFSADICPWELRRVGDDDTNPIPGIIGQKINDIFYHGDRLGMIGGSAIAMSQPGRPFDLWRSTASQVLDTDPIHTAASHNTVATLRHAVQFAEELLLFSDNTQFKVTSQGTLTSLTAKVDQTTEFAAARWVRPLPVGNRVYWPAKVGNGSALYEYFVEPVSGKFDRFDVTSHVPNVLGSVVRTVTANATGDAIAVVAANRPTEMWIYRFVLENNERRMSSWSVFTFEGVERIYSAKFFENDLYLVTQRAEGVVLERMPFETEEVTPGLDYHVRLDAMKEITGIHDPATNITTYTVHTPIATEDGVRFVALEDGVHYRAGEVIPHRRISSTTFEIDAFTTGTRILVGIPFTSSYTLSTIYHRIDGRTVQDGRTTFRRLNVSYADTAYFRATVRAANRSTYIYTMGGATLGSDSFILGRANRSSGTFTIPVNLRNIDAQVTLESDSTLPFWLTSATWDANLTVLSQRV